MKIMHIGFALALWPALLLVPAWAVELDEEQSFQGIGYVCTGVTGDARKDPRWGDYPAKLVFASTTGEYLADIAVTIRDAAGGPVFEATCPSPWLLIRLAPGRYEVTARSPDNQTQSTVITVLAERQQERILRFQ